MKKQLIEVKEWHRTLILVLLLAIAIGFIVWTDGQYSTNFVEGF